jgi:hypothetical protein
MRLFRPPVVFSSLLSLLPLAVWRPQFQLLFFFHDDWELLDRADRLSLGNWLCEPFLREGIFPLFKLLWLGAVHLTGGSYFGMILLLWLTHLSICLLFGWLLARFDLPPAAIVFSVLTFGVSWTNIETLGWSMQWNSQLAIVFFLAAWHCLLNTRPWAVGCFFCLLGSSLCSSRGIVSGLVLAVFVLLRNERVDRIRLSLLCLAPTAILLAIMWALVPHRSVDLAAALLYGWEYLILNPLFRPLPIPRHGFEIGALIICGALKTAVYVWAFWKAKPTVRPLLFTLVAFNLVVAATLGFSRWQTGLATVTSSRYQYIPLLCFGPMAGILIAELRLGARAAVIILCACGLVYPWKRHSEQWATERGIKLRAAIQQSDPQDRFDPSSLNAGRARELIQRYGLH